MSEKKEVKSFKVTPVFKEKVELLFKESGMDTQEQWFESLANLYEMQLLKEGMPGYKKSLDELDYHSKRINEIYIGMINTEAAERLRMSQSHEEVITIRNQQLFDQQAELTEMNKLLKVKTEEIIKAAKEIADLQKNTLQLEELARKNDLLVVEYKEKNDTLTGLLKEYKGAAEENKQISTKLTILTQSNKEQSEKIEELQDDIKILEEVSNERIKNQDSRNKEEIARLLGLKDIEKESALLKLQSEYQAKLEKNNEDTNVKLRELYEQISQLRGENEEKIAIIKREYEIRIEKLGKKGPSTE